MAHPACAGRRERRADAADGAARRPSARASAGGPSSANVACRCRRPLRERLLQAGQQAARMLAAAIADAPFQKPSAIRADRQSDTSSSEIGPEYACACPRSVAPALGFSAPARSTARSTRLPRLQQRVQSSECRDGSGTAVVVRAAIGLSWAWRAGRGSQSPPGYCWRQGDLGVERDAPGGPVSLPGRTGTAGLAT